MNSDQVKATVNRWLPLARALVSGVQGALIGYNIDHGDWGWVVAGVMVLVAMWWVPVGDILRHRRHDRTRSCTLCGQKPAWLYSLITPPDHGTRSLNRHVLSFWTLWSACPAHDARVREVIEEALDHARSAGCDNPTHDHSALRLYGISADYAKLSWR